MNFIILIIIILNVLGLLALIFNIIKNNKKQLHNINFNEHVKKLHKKHNVDKKIRKSHINFKFLLNDDEKKYIQQLKNEEKINVEIFIKTSKQLISPSPTSSPISNSLKAYSSNLGTFDKSDKLSVHVYKSKSSL